MEMLNKFEESKVNEAPSSSNPTGFEYESNVERTTAIGTFFIATIPRERILFCTENKEAVETESTKSLARVFVRFTVPGTTFTL